MLWLSVPLLSSFLHHPTCVIKICVFDWIFTLLLGSQQVLVIAGSIKHISFQRSKSKAPRVAMDASVTTITTVLKLQDKNTYILDLLYLPWKHQNSVLILKKNEGQVNSNFSFRLSRSSKQTSIKVWPHLAEACSIRNLNVRCKVGKADFYVALGPSKSFFHA